MNGNTLTYILEADASALTATFKSVVNQVTDLVSNMNSMSVDWESILTGTLDPAIISGIASAFGLAIEQSVQFQNYMTTAANNSGTAFQDSSSAIGQSVLDIQANTGQTGSAIANSMSSAIKTLGNASDGIAEVSTASSFATSTGQDLTTMVDNLTPVMQQWGVTGAQNITTTIQELFGAAAQGKIPLNELLTMLSNTGPMLKGKTSILEAANAMEQFSNQSGMTAQSADAFITKTVGNLVSEKDAANNSALGLGNLNSQNKLISSSGLSGYLATVEKSMNKMGTDSASILLSGAGFPPAVVANVVQADSSYKSLASNTAEASKNSLALGQGIESNVSPSAKIAIAWGKLKSDLTSSGIADFFATLLASLLKVADVIVSQMIPSIAGFFNYFKLGSQLADLLVGDLNPQSKISAANTAAEASVSSQYSAAKKAGDTSDATRLLKLFSTMVASDNASSLNPTGIDPMAASATTQNNQSQASPQTTNGNTSTVHNVVYNISSNAIGGGKTVGSQTIDVQSYNASFGH